MRMVAEARRKPSTAAGSMNCWRFRPGDSQKLAYPMGGIQWNQMAANVMTRVPSQKSGMLRPVTATTRPA